MKTINKNFVILFLVFIAASVFRGILNGHTYIDKFVACINVVAFLYVCYLILDKAYERLKDLIEDCNLFGDAIKHRKMRHFRNYSNLTCIILFIIGSVYTLFWGNPIVNDIVGFIALFFSIETEYISSCIGEMFFKIK